MPNILSMIALLRNIFAVFLVSAISQANSDGKPVQTLVDITGFGNTNDYFSSKNYHGTWVQTRWANSWDTWTHKLTNGFEDLSAEPHALEGKYDFDLSNDDDCAKSRTAIIEPP